MLRYVFIITFSSTIFSCTLFNNESINQMNSDELVEFVELNDAILLDVRTNDEFNSGHIENSLNIDYFSDEFYINVDKLDKNIPIILYCRSGRRSGLSANKIKKLGFKEIYNLEGGVLEWIVQGNVVVFNDNIN